MRRLVILAGCALSGCAVAPRDVPLAGLDLNDPAVIAKATGGLPQKERGAFAVYALLHWPEAKSYCGRSMFKGDQQPRTVGEAIDKTLEFDAALARKRADEKKPVTGFALESMQKQKLVDELDRLTLQRDMLESAPLPPSEKARRMQELERALADNRAARDKLASVPAFVVRGNP